MVRVEREWPSCQRAEALSSVDLCFQDGHVERWLGPGRIAEAGDVPQTVTALVAWGEEVIDEEGDSLLCELAMDFSDVSHNALADAPIEVVIQWNHEMDWPWLQHD